MRNRLLDTALILLIFALIGLILDHRDSRINRRFKRFKNQTNQRVDDLINTLIALEGNGDNAETA